MTDSDIAEFWNWFHSVAPVLEQDFLDERLLDEIDERVNALADISWELGPGISAQCAFVMTPDGSRSLLATTQRIVAMAPSIPDWEFHAARPPKKWNLQFSLEVAGAMLEIDVSPWRYLRISDGPTGETMIILEQNNLPHLEDSDRYAAATIALDSLLGEERRLSAFDRVRTTYRLEPGERMHSKCIAEISADTISRSIAIT